jgi:hypothetical protein
MAVGKLVIEFTLTGKDHAEKLLEAAQLARDLADDQPWNHEANEIADLIEQGLKGLRAGVK